MPTKTEVWMVRHGQQGEDPTGGLWQSKAPLTLAGRESIGRLAESLSDVEFTIITSSPLVRACETRDMIAAAQRHQPKVINEAIAFGPDSMQEWDDANAREPLPTTVVGIYDLYPHLLQREGRRVWVQILTTEAFLLDGQKAVGVSHQPLIESGAATAEGVWPPQYSLSKGDILIFYFEDGVFVRCEYRPLSV